MINKYFDWCQYMTRFPSSKLCEQPNHWCCQLREPTLNTAQTWAHRDMLMMRQEKQTEEFKDVWFKRLTHEQQIDCKLSACPPCLRLWYHNHQQTKVLANCQIQKTQKPTPVQSHGHTCSLDFTCIDPCWFILWINHGRHVNLGPTNLSRLATSPQFSPCWTPWGAIVERLPLRWHLHSPTSPPNPRADPTAVFRPPWEAERSDCFNAGFWVVCYVQKPDETHEPECWHVCWGRKAIHTDIVVGPPDMTRWSDTLVRHSCLTVLRNTLVSHSYFALSWDTLTWHVFSTLLRGHSYLTRFLDTLVGHSDLTLLYDTLTWHCCRTLWLDTLPWHFCSALLLDTLVGHSYLTHL